MLVADASNTLLWISALSPLILAAAVWLRGKAAAQALETAIRKNGVEAAEAARKAAVEAKEVKNTVAKVATDAATNADQVRRQLRETTAEQSKALEGIAAVGEKTHMLVNSAMGAQLKLGAETARALADLQPTPEHIAAADLAERTLAEHRAKQSIVDQGEKP